MDAPARLVRLVSELSELRKDRTDLDRTLRSTFPGLALPPHTTRRWTPVLDELQTLKRQLGLPEDSFA